MSDNGFGLLEIDIFCLTSDSLTTDQYFIEIFTCSLFTIYLLLYNKHISVKKLFTATTKDAKEECAMDYSDSATRRVFSHIQPSLNI